MTPPWIDRHQVVTPNAVVQVDTNRLTRRWTAVVAPLDDVLRWSRVSAQQLAAVPLCDTPAEVRAVLAGGAR